VPHLPKGWKDKVGLTPADVLLYLDEVLPKIEPEARDRVTRGYRITELMVEANEYDRRTHALTSQGAGILGWFRDQYLPRVNGALR
jgi:hypothetical protein